MSKLSRQFCRRLAALAHFCCGYYQTQEVVSGVPLTIEHIIPLAKGGADAEENLWLSCRLCNKAKGVLLEGADSETNQITPLFNPCTQRWGEHFAWDETGTRIIGQTATGRVTVTALSLNSNLRARSRAIWVEAGWHPPIIYLSNDLS